MGNCLIGVELGAKMGASSELCLSMELGAGTPENVMHYTSIYSLACPRSIVPNIDYYRLKSSENSHPDKSAYKGII